ncbi:MBL fold metallo-hydrolase [Sinomonas sp. ASV322]|uniref:MBL fold metallo-hydrolase n=1 Tax=Sinomonas sp. ASV322 TaxID=3041920 RepID=UPI0027DAD0B3|nr:MBL fold metallo-hydrolase [Sinomonas sp. ASV322]MDQ4500768.1 MBL fold metallo-hydrolase [Sinomonas sp. ASV322]
MPITTPASQPTPIAVGRWTVVPVIDAVGPAMQARAAFPALPPDELTALLDEFGDAHSTPDRSQLVLASQGFAIVGPGRVILVDTCLGGPKVPGGTGMRGFSSQWLPSLEQAGIPVEAVDTVINTHLHHDHVGWNTSLGADGTLRPTFPAARYLVPRADCEHFEGSPGTAAQRHIADCIAPLDRAGVLDQVAGEVAIDDGVRLVPAPGHTPGHTLVEVSGDGRRVLLAGDLIHHPLQLRRPDISAAMCVDPSASAATRREVLGRYADADTVFLASHLPAGGVLRRDGAAFLLEPA